MIILSKKGSHVWNTQSGTVLSTDARINAEGEDVEYIPIYPALARMLYPYFKAYGHCFIVIAPHWE